MVILGIDPGTAICGYGVVTKENYRFRLVDYGAVNTPPTMALEERLVRIYDGISLLIDKYHPDEMAVEELFFNNNAKTAISVGQARGVILLAGAHKHIPLYEYTPLQVKQGIVGYGRADKKQIQYMVKTMLNMSEIPKPDDAADALAIAICHGQSNKNLIP
ncbi:MAG: crossover junction endodeoxyribonuclease RuvC [Bacillota bacterium]|nr:crossover junction endodeoxyribonuclease RuvC [Bacillota bacterium]